MPHHIKLIEDKGKSFVLNIDGIHIELTKRLNRFDWSDLSALAVHIDMLHDRITNNQPIDDLVPVLNGANTFRILALLFEEEVFDYWVSKYDEYFSAGVRIFVDVFSRVFGFVYSPHRKPSSLETRMREYAAEKFSLKGTAQNEASSVEYTVKEMSLRNNVITYSINNISVDICLSGHQNMRNANHVLATLLGLRDALISKDDFLLKLGIGSLGARASISIISSFFSVEMIEYLNFIVLEKVYAHREQIHPSVILKELFGGHRVPYYMKLLCYLEGLLPQTQRYLLESNNAEMLSSKNYWRLYDKRANGLTALHIYFFGSSEIVNQLQHYLLHKAQSRKGSDKIPQYIYNVWLKINIALIAFQDDLAIELNTISDLSTAHIQELTSYLAQCKNYTVATQKNVIVELRAFYNYYFPETGKSPFQMVKIPSIPLNPIRPASKIALTTIIDQINMLPPYIRLAIWIAFATGARANSICELTTDALSKSENGYAIKVCGYKTAVEKMLNHKPCITTHPIPDTLAFQIIDYIIQTEELRKQMDKPYLFVYKTKAFREDTLRKPHLLSPSIFRWELNRILSQCQQYDESGNHITVNFRNIRAEVGRSMFAHGATENEVAAKLGNTPIIARMHYAKLYPDEVAGLYNQQYHELEVKLKETLEKKEKVIEFPKHSSKELYGHCNYASTCQNQNDCRTCAQRLVCKEVKLNE